MYFSGKVATQLTRQDLSEHVTECIRQGLSHPNIPRLVQILQNFFYATMLTNEFQGSLSPDTYEQKNMTVTRKFKYLIDYSVVVNVIGLKIVQIVDNIWHQTISLKQRYYKANLELEVTLIQNLVNRRKLQKI